MMRHRKNAANDQQQEADRKPAPESAIGKSACSEHVGRGIREPYYFLKHVQIAKDDSANC
jgi:hypothetical protein